ncbi:hypothetical protein Nepgr_013895 [Nepenthes gracilis]|uniref:B box-type domain-containing protein n=1 Tax=Nepenthes gracilis TaxID=150966 RepID=A0AAD3SJR3_NEPGR|nr:hypothetical protein Nepgr_013895 [Nepenthes gracilis]
MCQVKEQGSQDDAAVSAHASMDATSCELCGSEAALYCLADDAYLCRKCDKWVHGANFLASRHIRCLLCGTCQRLTHRYLVGSSVELMLPSILGRRAERFVLSSSDDYVTEPSTPLKMPFLFL